MAAKSLIAAALLAACSASPVTPDAFLGFCSERSPVDPTYTNVQRLFQACTSCHGTGVELPLSPAVSYANLINAVPPSYTVPPTDESCGVVLVKPGDPDGSYLYQKVALDQPCAGSRMPVSDIGAAAPLAACAQAVIHDWIAQGAQNN